MRCSTQSKLCSCVDEPTIPKKAAPLAKSGSAAGRGVTSASTDQNVTAVNFPSLGDTEDEGNSRMLAAENQFVMSYPSIL